MSKRSTLTFIKGAIKKMSAEQAVECIAEYPAGNNMFGDGDTRFYLPKDTRLAEFYTDRMVELMGGTRTINIYKIDVKKIYERVKESYFDNMNVRYSCLPARNSECPRSDFIEELCKDCSLKCYLSDEYIDNLLQDSGLEDIFVEFVTGHIDEHEAMFKLRDILRQVKRDAIITAYPLKEALSSDLEFVDSFEFKEEDLI